METLWPPSGHLELLRGGVQGVLHQVGVVAAPLQQHQDVLELQVDVGVPHALHRQHRPGAGGGGGGAQG